MIDPVSMYLMGGSKPVNSGMEAAYIPAVDADRRRQQTGQQAAEQSGQERDTGVVVSISEEARSQSRMNQMLAGDAAGMPADGVQVQNQTEESVREAPEYQREDGGQQYQNQALMQAEAQYQASGAMAMAGLSFMRMPEEGGAQQEEQFQVDETGDNAGRNVNARFVEAAGEAGSNVEMEIPGEQTATSVERPEANEPPEETRPSETTGSENRAAQFMARTPFSYVSQTYQGMTSTMEPLMSSFMLGA